MSLARTANPAAAGHAHALSLARQGRLDDACLAWHQALQVDPANAEAQLGLGIALLGLHHVDGAKISLVNAMSGGGGERAALVLGECILLGSAASANAPRHLATLCLPPAVEAGTPVASPAPGQLDPWSAVACAAGYSYANRRDAARAVLDRELLRCPAVSRELCRFAVAFARMGDKEAALAIARRCMAIGPRDAREFYELGEVFRAGSDLANAATCYRHSISMMPEQTDAFVGLGDVLFGLGQTDDAKSTFEAGLRRAEFQANKLRSAMLMASVRSSRLDMAALFAEHRHYAEQIELPLRPYWPELAKGRDRRKVLNVGFLSADLRNHPIAYYLEAVIGHLARNSNLRLHAYSASGTRDRVTLRLEKAFATWRQVEALSDAELAATITGDGIDILIELSGHSGGNRLPALARKPAPIQVTWIGYPCTTGLEAIDYFIGDDHFPPPGRFESWFTERVIRLPASVAFVPSTLAPTPNALPALTRKGLTFASFNHASKLTADSLTLWIDVLQAVPNARLLVYSPEPDSLATSLGPIFLRGGIETGRIEYRKRQPLSKYLAAHHEVDLCLDTVPYNGGTTTLHALSMGVPTLTLTADSPAGHVGASLLRSVGLDGFVCETRAGICDLARHWAGELPALAEIRQGLPARLARSPIGRPELIAASLERALRLIWIRHCDGLPPADLRVGVEDLAPTP